jgi:hypothetical protein
VSVNKYKPHVWVLPEDDANRQLANGFLLHADLDPTAIDIRPVAGGWRKAVDAVAAQHIAELRNYPCRQLVLLVDLDKQGEARVQQIREAFPPDLQERIYLLSSYDEPEALKVEQGRSFERLGEDLAEACARDELGLWGTVHLQHNKPELNRLVVGVKQILFPRLPNTESQVFR